MQRIPEPELMNEPEQVDAYASADFEQPHNQFIEEFRQRFGDSISGRVLDLGCGPCDISIRFARAFPACQIDAVDGAENMLSRAMQDIQQQNLEERIKLIRVLLPAESLPAKYDTIISNSLLHHLDNAAVLWATIQQHSKSGSNIFIMDLMRPESTEQARHLLETYAADEPEVLRQDFFHSLLAAYTVEEIQQQIEQAQLDYLQTEIITDRHFIVYGTRP